MPSTENATLQRIQQEIKESVEREEELRKGYSQLNGNSNGVNVNGSSVKPMLVRAQSTSVLNEPELPAKNGFRRFTPNPGVKGVMHKFIKSRGRLSTTTIQTNGNGYHAPPPTPSWNTPDEIIEPAKITVEPSKCIRKGYIPIQERMRQELQEYSAREKELRNERKKSQPNLIALLDAIETSPPPERRLLKGARSMSQLYDAAEELPEDTVSAPSSLKPARSLAQLIDAEEAVEVPGTHSLILQFENLSQQRNGHAS